MSRQPVSQLAGGASLAPGEAPLVSDRFMLSTIAFYLHTDLVLTNRRLYSLRPSTVLKLIRVSSDRSSFPIENIADVRAGTRFELLGIFVGAFGILFGLAALAIPSAAPLGVILLLLGGASVVGAPKQAIEVMNSGGGVIRFPLSVLERGHSVDFANKVSEAVARTTNRDRQHSFDQAPQPGAAESFRRLQDLRDQGVITEGEYAAKRTEIIARL